MKDKLGYLERYGYIYSMVGMIPITREELREYLNPIYDLERLITRITYQTANPRDLIALLNSLKMLPHIRFLLQLW